MHNVDGALLDSLKALGLCLDLKKVTIINDTLPLEAAVVTALLLKFDIALICFCCCRLNMLF